MTEMSDDEVAAQIERADRFTSDLCELLAATVITSDAQRLVIDRIAGTLDAVPYVTWCNVANLNAALRGEVLSMIELRLRCVGGGPALDVENALEFFAPFERMWGWCAGKGCNNGMTCQGGARCGACRTLRR
jgi:hypothetical protein